MHQRGTHSRSGVLWDYRAVAMDEADTANKRAFDAAFKRFCSAQSVEEQHDEMSNMLHQFFRAVERRGGVDAFAKDPSAHEHAAAVSLVRHKDTHEVVAIVDLRDVFSDTFTDLFGSLVWALPASVKADKRYARYDAAYLEGQPVADTLRRAFDAVIALPRIP